MNDNDFRAFAKMVAASFQELASDAYVFTADLDGDVLWQAYLDAFPEGTNVLFRKRAEHDCSCCRHLVRRVGGAVRIEGDALRTVWDRAAKEAPGVYLGVASCMREVVRTSSVRDLFRVGQNESSFGAAQTRSLDAATGNALTWNHLHTGEVPTLLVRRRRAQPGGDFRTTVQVFSRGLSELSPEAVDTVLSLVADNGLYRGEEHRPALLHFQAAQRTYLSKMPGRERDFFAWAHASGPAARFRNTVIGTLVQDLSEGVDVERAVHAFEAKVAPQNYKRTTALITPGMVKKAVETIESLGLEPALERRFAVLGDVSVGDVKWVDGAVKPLMKGGIGDVLMQHASSSRGAAVDNERMEDVGIDEFVSKVLPETTGLEILFKGEHAGNLVSLTAPVHPEPRQLFRWTNDFAWSYSGNVADSIKERVKAAGGRVDGVLRASLSWFNFDDLDLHVLEPPNAGRGVKDAFSAGRIYYGNKRGWTGGTLDVDMNAGGDRTRAPVENTVWATKPPDGAYKVIVNNYCQREIADLGFVVEVECGGKLHHYSYNKGVRHQQDVVVATLHVKDGLIVRVESGDPGVTPSNVSQERWGLKTEQYAKVSAVMLSPNYWGDSAVGNKHTLFVLEGARNDEPTRGFYNEFLHPRLEAHRKVFEVIADKTKCAPLEGQLSGLGFSSTKSAHFVARAQQGKKRRLFHVHVAA